MSFFGKFLVVRFFSTILGYGVASKYNLISNYTIKNLKVHPSKVNEENVKNIVERKFDDRTDLEVLVSDLTYVKVGNKWHYICLIINLQKAQIFHTDRGSEFKNKTIDELLEVFQIQRSLSKKGCPCDNAVAEATYKIVKTEFAFDRVFVSQEELDRALFDYVNWYNTKRLHSSLGYVTPCEFKG